MFTEALFTIARTWQQTKCPSTDECMKMIWHACTMEYYFAIKRNSHKNGYYLAIKRNEIELFVVRWMDPESVIQSEVSQKEKNG